MKIGFPAQLAAFLTAVLVLGQARALDILKTAETNDVRRNWSSVHETSARCQQYAD
jgi:hypothetical protein